MITNGKKISILCILEILRDYSDETHYLTQAEIANKLYSIYGKECERKSISANIDDLIDFGFDIIKSKRGCCLCSREFEPSEIQFLIDAVFSSKSIDGTHSRELANKLSKILSIYQRKQYKYIYKSSEINRTNSKELFYNIDVINEAIEKGKQIKFIYNRNSYRDAEKKKRPYIINPYFLINNQGKYFLVCNYNYFDKIANYKVDRISNIEILDTDVKPVTELQGYEKGLDVAKYANENIYMFGTKTVNATIKVFDDFTTSYVDEWFGKNARLYEKNGEIFADITTNEKALIYWCLQYGESVELISPQESRDQIKEIISEMHNRYGCSRAYARKITRSTHPLIP